MRILNLYAGIGGNRKLWGDEHEIVAVENEQYIADVYKHLYPNDTVVVADAHQFLLDHFREFDFIWSSPPCPSHSRIRLARPERIYPDMRLYQEIIFLSHWYKGDWIVENVKPYYEPLIEPKAEIDRHYFWSNRWLGRADYAKRQYNVTRATKETLAENIGIVLPVGTKNQRKLLRNVVLPKVGLFLLDKMAAPSKQGEEQ